MMMMREHVETATTPPPEARASSPSPSLSPVPAISSCPSPDRTFSTLSSLSSFSANSGDARSSIISTISTASGRRRGYIRPQGAEFSESAIRRESVMSLGSIAHLQYYFARTGLLDGKGAQMAKEWKKKKDAKDIPKLLLTSQPDYGEEMVDSPMDELIEPTEGYDEHDDIMLPPTVSTYSVKTYHTPPPPDLMALRKDLVDALEQVEKSIENMENNTSSPRPQRTRDSLTPDPEGKTSEPTTPQGWREVQGMSILDVVTLAIRAARIYYTAHERPERLAAIKSEKHIREELLGVLDVMKRFASRNFAKGLKDDEKLTILSWMAGVCSMLDEERKLEKLEAEERANWIWVRGDWTGREREREESFLRSLANPEPPLPQWHPAQEGSLPSAMLERLRDGRDLIQMHNQAVKKSKRPFGQIKSFHEDIGKPYRRAENLRYWIKAAEIRWEIKLEMDVLGVVYGSSDEAWKQFDAAILAWCKGVREELMRDWNDEAKASTEALPSPQTEELDR
ncbi:hypothetical protein DTO027B9_4750 [Paecilomyces variotii]|nr:hypothetical protein DTO027B9_4750 [Paecilomyces variotii]